MCIVTLPDKICYQENNHHVVPQPVFIILFWYTNPSIMQDLYEDKIDIVKIIKIIIKKPK